MKLNWEMLQQQGYRLMKIRGVEIEVAKRKKNKLYRPLYDKSYVDTSNWWAEDIYDRYSSIHK
jgi:hypothetical protein